MPGKDRNVTLVSGPGAIGWASAIAYAAGYLASDRDEPMLASEILANCGYRSALDLKKAGANAYDIQQCKPAFRELKGRRP